MTDEAKILITPEYREQNIKLHETRLDYGAMGSKHAEGVRGIAQVYDCKSLLDYGCGKQTLIETLRLPWARGYDPCVPGLDGDPLPADLVVCTDTLEHVEPDCLEATLDHLRKLSKRLAYFSISLVPAKKTLPDGRNTHLIVQPAAWWLWRLLARWEMDTCRNTDSELTCVLRVPGERARDPIMVNNVRK